MKKNLLSLMLLLCMAWPAMAQKRPQLGQQSNAEIILNMTLEEKVRLVVGMGMNFPMVPAPAPAAGGTPAATPAPAPQGPVVGTTQQKVPGAAGTTANLADLGIPTLVVADGPAGLRISPTRPGETRTFYATAFPIATLLAASWDLDLVYQTGLDMGSEVKAYGVDVLLGPGMNIHRNPLGGRNFEYFSEDPYLTGKMAASIVKGIQANGVGTSVKHFAANNHETNRNMINVKVSPRALREIYLRGFEIVVREAAPWTVMSSYNKVNGPYTSENPELLKTVLRDDWGFKGFVMTDWFGGRNAAAQMVAGNDLLMPGGQAQMDTLLAAVRRGDLPEKYIDENVDRMLNIIRVSPTFLGHQPSNNPDLKGHAERARKTASEGMVLLKNEAATLPAKPQPVAVFGNYSYDLVSGGTGSGDVNEAYTISLPDGLSGAGFTVDAGLRTLYETYIAAEKAKQPPRRSFFAPPVIVPEMAILPKDLKKAASTNAMAIITIGRIAGEGGDRKVQDDYYLSAAEKQLIADVAKAFHAKGKKVVVMLNIGGVIETASWRDLVDGILLTWLPGQEAGNAIADVLSGKVNPSGKLPTSFLVKYEDDPAAEGFPGQEYGPEIDLGRRKARASEITYQEGVFVGYRAFDKRNIAPAYEFGYGLSYTTFGYSDLKLSSPAFSGSITATVTVTNTGKVAGREVVQVYLAAPGKSMEKPLAELKAFGKTGLLQPGQSETLTFTLDARSLTSFDEGRSAWVAEAGTYTVKIGASSRDIRAQASFTLATEQVVERVNKALEME